mmetsp:Transcript_27531/g.41201  ORF Transcript_27531/g.41201 Transcript_27531/m.41201 type:complete len:587 (+) Transcript_27531:18-1778(+)
MSYTFDEDNEEYVYSSGDEEEMSDEYDMVDHYGNFDNDDFCGNLSDEEDFDEALYSCRDFFHNQENTLPDEEEYDDDFYTLSPNEVTENLVITSKERVRMVIWSDLLPTMKQQISEVIEVLGIPASAASVLMREFRWSKEQLMEEFTNNPERVKRLCGVYNRCSKKKTDKRSIARTRYALYSRQSTPEKMRFCEICFEDGGFAPEDMIAMPCGHEFCRDCWRGFISNMLREGTVCLTYTCPQVGCNEKVTEEEVQKAAPNLLSKYREHQLKAFAETNMHSRWCPGKGCNRVAVGNPHLSASGKVVCGDCDSTFCFKCGEEPHSPLTCHDLVRWKDKCKDESETAKWIVVHTKTCPKCTTRIEKNGGCNHMTCRKCKYEFCWICMKNWNSHINCNTFTSKDGDDPSDGTMADSKRELERYLHHYERYQAHNMAQQVAEKAKQKFIDDELGNRSSPNAFLKDAHDQLVECRRVLKYTFSFAYLNMTDASNDVEKRTFEYHQGMLERFTENLSELCEKAFEEVDSAEVINLTRVVEGFIQNVLAHVENSVGEYTPKITSAQNNGSLLKQKLKLPSMPMTRHLFRRERSN